MKPSQCLRCGYRWKGYKKTERPKRCARCRSKYWNVPRLKGGYPASKYEEVTPQIEMLQRLNSSAQKPVCLDLCCGKGGWAKGFISEGWHVVGVDLADFSKVYPGEFIQANLITWESWRKIPARLVVASTPCEEFSRWSMPWLRAKNPPKPNLALWHRANFIARALGVPIVQENVKGAQRFLGRSKGNCGPFHLWGAVPETLPVYTGKAKESYGSKDKVQRAVIPFHLARHVARWFSVPRATPALAAVDRIMRLHTCDGDGSAYQNSIPGGLSKAAQEPCYASPAGPGGG